MPANSHLKPFDIGPDFTKGMFDQKGVNTLLGPNDGFSDLTDYYPQKEGGLRAFFSAVAVGNTGIPTVANKAVMGLFARDGVPLRSGAASDSFDAFLTTIDNTDFKARVYRMDGSNAETTWKQVGATVTDTPAGSGVGHQVSIIKYFKDTTGAEWYMLVLSGGGNQGLYKIAYVGGAGPPAGDGVTTKLQAFTGPLAISQARIIVGTGNDEKIHYSDVGATTFTNLSSQVVGITPNQGEPNVSIISPIEPADLLVGKEGAAWVEINGDISSTSTPIRELGQAHYQRQNKQDVPRVPNGGIAFIEFGGRIFVTDGRTFNSISDPIARFTGNHSFGLVGQGQMAVLNNMLFAPGGKVYDFDTGAWFKSTDFANSLYHHSDPYAGNMWMATEGASFGVSRMGLFDASAATHKTSGSFTTLPISDPTGRLLEVREVQVYVQTFTTSTITVSIIDSAGNTVYTATNNAVTGRDGVRFGIPNVQDQYLKIKVDLSSNNGTTEAPLVERLRVFFGQGNLIR